MTTYTVPVNEAATRLPQLIKQAQATHSSVILTEEGTFEPVAVLLESNAFAEVQRDRLQLFHLQRSELMHWLDQAQGKWDDRALRQDLITVWQKGVKTLWNVGPTGSRRFLAMLRMAVNRLSLDGITLQQTTVLRECLDLLRHDPLEQQDVEKCRHRLMECGLPPMPIGDDALAQMYIDEL